MDTADSKEPDTELMDRLTAVIIRNDNTLANLSILNQFPSSTWYRKLNSRGKTLLQICILYNKKQAFDFLLPFYDLESLETWGNNKTETAFSIAIKMTRFEMAVLLLEKGVNANFQDDCGNTALHTVLIYKNFEEFNFYEIVAALLYYNSDPRIQNDEGYVPFDYAVKYNHDLPLQEILFFYTFDEHINCQINIETVIDLAMTPLFYEIFKYNITSKYIDVPFMNPFRQECNYFFCLLVTDTDRLEIMIRNCGSALEEMISVINFECTYLGELTLQALTSMKGINNLNLLFENAVISKPECILGTLDSIWVFLTAVTRNREEVATEILTFLMSYGLNFGEAEYEIVYKLFGYSSLFKFLLYSYNETPDLGTNIVPRIMCDIHFDLENVLKNEPSCKESLELMPYFAHHKMAKYLMNSEDAKSFPEKTIASIQKHPKVPRLEEMARNVFRKHLVDTFQIDRASIFFSYVNRLPISKVHKKIITFETKLYNL